MSTPTSSKIALVTGAGSGIGRAVAIGLLNDGWTVVLAGRRAEPLQTLVAEAATRGQTALAVPTDVTAPDSVEALFATITQTYGRLTLAFGRHGLIFGRLDCRILRCGNLDGLLQRQKPALILSRSSYGGKRQTNQKQIAHNLPLISSLPLAHPYYQAQ